MLPVNTIVQAKLVSTSLTTQPFIEVLPKDSQAHKNVIATSSSGIKLQAVKRKRLMLTLVSSDGQHFAIDVYKTMRLFYPGVHFNEKFLDNLYNKLQDFTFQIKNDEILNLEEILKSI